jgi:hypothetical protein
MANFAMAQNRGIRSVFEIGSVRRYMIAEKILNSLRLSRVKFYGPSLLRVLYAYYPKSKILGSGTFDSALTDEAVGSQNMILPAAEGDGVPGYGDNASQPVGGNFGAPDSTRNNRDFWINLQSVVFRQPLGLGLYFKASNNRPYGACYLEEAMLGSHALNVDAEAIVMQEAVDAQFDRVVPIKLAVAA